MASPCNRNKAQKILTKSDHCNLIFNHPASGYDASSQKLQHRFRSGFVHVGFACGSGLVGWGLVFRTTARRSRLGTLKGEAIKFRICKHSSINLLMQGQWNTIPWMTLTLRCWSRHWKGCWTTPSSDEWTNEGIVGYTDARVNARIHWISTSEAPRNNSYLLPCIHIKERTSRVALARVISGSSSTHHAWGNFRLRISMSALDM